MSDRSELGHDRKVFFFFFIFDSLDPKEAAICSVYFSLLGDIIVYNVKRKRFLCFVFVIINYWYMALLIS